MINWNQFTPSDFEYDFEHDKLEVHRVTFEEAVECFFSGFEVRRNKAYRNAISSLAERLVGVISKLSSSSNLAMSSELLQDGQYEKERS